MSIQVVPQTTITVGLANDATDHKSHACLNAVCHKPEPSKDELPQHLVTAMQGIFGKHPGYRTSK